MNSAGSVAIRAAVPEDAHAIAAVNAAAGREGWRDFLPPETLEGLDPPQRQWELRLAAAPGDVLVAARGDEVVGFASVRAPAEPGEPGEIGALYTHPRVWGTGVGRALLARALERLREQGSREAVLWTERRNRRPRAIYEAAGWHEDGGARERDFLGHPIAEVRYRIVLAPARR